MYLVVSSEDMPRLDMSYSVVPKLVVMMVVPSRYMMVTMANTRVHREMRSSHGGSNKEGEEESSCLDCHGLDTDLGESGWTWTVLVLYILLMQGLSDQLQFP